MNAHWVTIINLDLGVELSFDPAKVSRNSDIVNFVLGSPNKSLTSIFNREERKLYEPAKQDHTLEVKVPPPKYPYVEDTSPVSTYDRFDPRN
jgi:hypothetical protein